MLQQDKHTRRPAAAHTGHLAHHSSQDHIADQGPLELQPSIIFQIIAEIARPALPRHAVSCSRLDMLCAPSSAALLGHEFTPFAL